MISETASPGSGRQSPLRTLVLLHAFPLNADMWHPQTGVPPAGWRMIAPDYRGFGDSSVPDPSTTMNDLAGDVVDLLDRLELTEGVFAGCSLGGYVLFELLKSAPNYVKGIVLVDTRATADSDEAKAGRRKMIDKISDGGSAAIADEMTPKLLGETTKREQPNVVERVHRMIAGADPMAIKMAVTAMMNRRDMSALLNELHLPTLIIAGQEDTLIPLADMQKMQGAIRGASFETVPLAGHLPNLEQPAAFDASLQRFLQRF